jgi:protein-disulfide isomerase
VFSRAGPAVLCRLLAAFGLLSASCCPTRVACPCATPPAASGPPQIAAPAPATPIPADPPPIPVSSADPSWGNPDAPVTVVWFDDLQCPFCAMAAAGIDQLEKRYGSEKLRVVHKSFPLPFHREAEPAALASAAVFDAGGNDAFWKFVGKVFADQGAMGRDQYLKWADEVGVGSRQVDLAMGGERAKAKVSADVALGQAIGVAGTPCFFVNGVKITGAQPLDTFTGEIDRQLLLAEELVRHGMARAAVHVELTKSQFAPGEAPDSAPDEAPEDDATAYQVPVVGSPVRGPSNAPVTIVEFTDFQCPFCQEVQSTIDELRRRYGGKIRIVFKHNPLPFHPRAEPLARLAIEARKQKGDRAFWRAHDAIWAADRDAIDDAHLEQVARSLGLELTQVRRTLSERRYADVIAADRDLADRLQATGTPTFFINGRRLVGAQPIEKFTTIIDDEMAKAEQLLSGKRKVKSVYDEIQKNAKPLPAEKPR